MYADDLCLYRVIKSSHDIVSFQNDIDTLVNEVSDLNLMFNVKKCKFITFSRKSNPTSFSLVIDGSPAHEVSSLKYLGFFLTKDLSWMEHIRNMF